MTHIAWVPEEWVEAAEDVLRGSRGHPSRTIFVLFPGRGGEGLAREASESDALRRRGRPELLHGHDSDPATGTSAEHPTSVVEPLLVPDLPVFLRWRGASVRRGRLEELTGVADRLIVDSTEWPGLPGPIARMVDSFERIAVSDIAWARTSRWRSMLASLWPAIGTVERIKVTGTEAQAHLLAGWLRIAAGETDRIGARASNKLVGVELDGKPAPFPPGEPPSLPTCSPDELDKVSRATRSTRPRYSLL